MMQVLGSQPSQVLPQGTMSMLERLGGPSWSERASQLRAMQQQDAPASDRLAAAMGIMGGFGGSIKGVTSELGGAAMSTGLKSTDDIVSHLKEFADGLGLPSTIVKSPKSDSRYLQVSGLFGMKGIGDGTSLIIRASDHADQGYGGHASVKINPNHGDAAVARGVAEAKDWLQQAATHTRLLSDPEISAARQITGAGTAKAMANVLANSPKIGAEQRALVQRVLDRASAEAQQ